MHEVTVWAPNARKVAVKIDETMYPMLGPNERGWWGVAVEQAGPGTDYGFVVGDDAQAWPDPRAEWQPYGVHGGAPVSGQAAFWWSGGGWQAASVSGPGSYELTVRERS